jgi:hypothetical protein
VPQENIVIKGIVEHCFSELTQRRRAAAVETATGAAARGGQRVLLPFLQVSWSGAVFPQQPVRFVAADVVEQRLVTAVLDGDRRFALHSGPVAAGTCGCMALVERTERVPHPRRGRHGHGQFATDADGAAIGVAARGLCRYRVVGPPHPPEDSLVYALVELFEDRAPEEDWRRGATGVTAARLLEQHGVVAGMVEAVIGALHPSAAHLLRQRHGAARARSHDWATDRDQRATNQWAAGSPSAARSPQALSFWLAGALRMPSAACLGRCPHTGKLRITLPDGGLARRQVRTTLSWPRSWTNFSLLY